MTGSGKDEDEKEACAFLTVYANRSSPSIAKIIPTGANFFVLLWLLLDLDIYVCIMHLRVVAGKPHSQDGTADHLLECPSVGAHSPICTRRVTTQHQCDGGPPTEGRRYKSAFESLRETT